MNLKRFTATVLFILAISSRAEASSMVGIDNDTNWINYGNVMYAFGASIQIPQAVINDYLTFTYNNIDSFFVDTSGSKHMIYKFDGGYASLSKSQTSYPVSINICADAYTNKKVIAFFKGNDFGVEWNDSNRLSNGILTAVKKSSIPDDSCFRWSIFPKKFPKRLPFDTVSVDEVINKVIVKNLSWTLKDNQNDCYSFFGDSVANTSFEQQFSWLTTRNWEKKRDLFESKLCERARNLGYDNTLLQKCFAIVRNENKEGLAYIPIAAYFTSQNDETIYLIVTKWEGAGTWENFYTLGHGRMWGIRLKDYSKICFVTCG